MRGLSLYAEHLLLDKHVRLPSSAGCKCQESWIIEIAVFGKAALRLDSSGMNVCQPESVLSAFWKKKLVEKGSEN